MLFPSFYLLWAVFVVVPWVLVGVGLGCLFAMFLFFLGRPEKFITMNFPLSIVFAVSHKFRVVLSSFSFVSRNVYISSLISLLTHSLFISLKLVSNFRPCGLIKCLIWLQFSWIFLKFNLFMFREMGKEGEREGEKTCLKK